MPIGTSEGEYFEDENDHAYQTHFAGKVTDPIQVPDKFSNAPRTSTAPYRGNLRADSQSATSGNLGDILGMDVNDIPEGVSARDYFQQLQRQTDENYKTNTQKPVTTAPQKGASMEDPTGARDLFLVRHGCTDLNGEGGTSTDKIRGWSDVPLNDIGRDDARRAGDSLKGKGITAIVASDLSRAKETADIIGQKIGVTPTYTMKLRPWDLGKFTGEPADESREALKEYSTAKADEKVPGGESFNDFKFRALQGVSEALQQHPHDQVAVVTHHRVERLLNAWDKQGQPTDGELHEPTFLQKGEPPGGHQIIKISDSIHNITPAFEGGDFDNKEDIERIIRERGAIEVDPRNSKVKDFLNNMPSDIESKPNESGTNILRLRPQLVSANDKGQPGTEGPYYEYDDNSEIHLNSMKEYNDNIHQVGLKEDLGAEDIPNSKSDKYTEAYNSESDKYNEAYKELFNGSRSEPDWKDKLSPRARDLLGESGVPFPDWGKEENEAFIKKHGYEKAITALDGLLKGSQDRYNHYKSQKNPQGDMDAMMAKDRIDRLTNYKADLLSRQGY